MIDDDPRTPLEIVAAELYALGLTIRQLPGEYLVNFRNSGDKTARFAEGLGKALELGRAMAEEAGARQASTEKAPRRRWRRKRMTPKARRRRFIRGHNRRVRERALRKQRGKL